MGKIPQESRLRLKELDSLRRTVIGYPVVVFTDTVFYLYTRIGAMRPKERASVISGKIKRIAKDYTVSPDSIEIRSDGSQYDIWSGSMIIMAVSPKDSWVEGISEYSLALKYRDEIKKCIVTYRADVSLKHLLIQIGLSLLVFIAFVTTLKFTTRLFRWMDTKVIRNIKTPEKWHQFGDTQILSARGSYLSSCS